MACTCPLTAWQADKPNEQGKRPLIWNPKDSNAGQEIQLPCGQCINCRLEYSRQWAMRCVHESQMHLENSFITLTYSDDYLPTNGSLQKKDFQDFLKRLREEIRDEQPNLRFFMCGEYGTQCKVCKQNEDDCRNYTRHQYVEDLGRPHYHALLFGYDFTKDREPWRKEGDTVMYRSETLEKVWPYGHSEIGELTFESAAYVARYIVKKQNGENADDHYATIDSLTNEPVIRTREYCSMSRGGTNSKGRAGGIGASWFTKYGATDLEGDSLHMRGKRMRPPKYYDRLLERDDPDRWEQLIEQRKEHARTSENDSVTRLMQRSQLAKHRVKRQRRENL